MIPDGWTLTPDGPYWHLRGPDCNALFKCKEDAEVDIRRMIAARCAIVPPRPMMQDEKRKKGR